jgi:hypothetical protein
MSGLERTSAGLQMVIPGCERRTLPKSTTRVDEAGQGLLHYRARAASREEFCRRRRMLYQQEAHDDAVRGRAVVSGTKRSLDD